MSASDTPRTPVNGGSLSRDELVRRCRKLEKQITETLARAPNKTDGVYWLHSPEWGILKNESAAKDATIARLREALSALYFDQLDYITLNHLCGAEDNHVMKQARAALTQE